MDFGNIKATLVDPTPLEIPTQVSKRTKTEIKYEAQDLICLLFENAVMGVADDARGHSQRGFDPDELIAEINKQADRVRRLFGYEV
jgi:hypothetical protein|tara:strand:- start:343 stop:600 length:258 start_codon:yes stop_codon:yes gene_type:complete